MKAYRPNVELAKHFYSARLRTERMRRSRPAGGKRIRNNSEPWVENPRSLEDVERICDGILETLKDLTSRNR
jgi:hypothetical protein